MPLNLWCCFGGVKETKAEEPTTLTRQPTVRITDTKDRKKFEDECLEEHNILRAYHECPPLKLSRHLCDYASQWAKKLANERALKHRTDGKYGENLFMCSGYAVDGRSVVREWYDEIANYDFSSPDFKRGTGHFTQVVWKDSRELGVGIAWCGPDSMWVVANYDPPGNILTQFKKNVPRPLR